MPRFEVIQGGKDEDAPVLRDVSKGKKGPKSIEGGLPLYQSKLYTEQEIQKRARKRKNRGNPKENSEDDNEPDPIMA